MAQGIKETQDLLVGLKDLAVVAKKLVVNKSDWMADLPVLLGLLAKLGELTAAVQGVDQVPAELKDLDAGEINTLMVEVLAIVNAVKAA